MKSLQLFCSLLLPATTFVREMLCCVSTLYNLVFFIPRSWDCSQTWDLFPGAQLP
jgi:hypothetical protein